MSRIIRTGASLVLVAALVAFAQSAMALGLGNVRVESYLGQPLRAKIELITREGDDLGSMTIGLASAEDFALIGASLDAISVPLSFSLEKDGEASSILITSKLSVKDPVMRLIVEVNWTNGRMLREYTLFLDPPTFASAEPSPVVDQRSGSANPALPATAERKPIEPVTRREEPATPVRPVTATTAPADGAEYGPVQGGETLWSIALNWSSGSGLDMRAVMLAIQQQNPQAFISGNINLLKRGAVLRMPQASEVRDISAAAALREVLRQNEEYGDRLAASTGRTPLVDPNSQAQADSGDEQKPLPADQLELVPPASDVDAQSANGLEESPEGSDTSTSVDALRAELSRKEEELIVEQQQNQYLQDQIAELQDQLAPASEGNVADAELAQLEDRLQEQRLADSGDANQQAATPEADVARKKPPAVPQVVTVAPQTTQQAWYQSVVVWLLLLLVLAAVLAGWYWNRRKRDDWDAAEDAAAADAAAPAAPQEAEESLLLLRPDRPQAQVGKGGDTRAEAAVEAEPAEQEQAQSAPQEDELATELDEESTDPEVRLDLARAYISMGDKEAARVILDEVMGHGTDEQQREARAMLDSL
jgi:pilus assembly protein FimV